MKTNLFRKIKLLLCRDVACHVSTACCLLLLPLPCAAQQPVSVCASAGYTLTSAAAATGAAEITYEWLENDMPVANSNAATLAVAAGKTPGTYHYVRRVSCTGCEEWTPSNTFTVVVNAVPVAPTGASSHSRCDAGALTFSATPPEGCTIDWYNVAAATTIGSSTVTAGTTSWTSGVLNSTTSYYAQARDETTGCVSGTRLTVTGTINVATATIAGAAGNTCPAATVSLTATAAGATSYTWYKDGQEVQSGTNRNYTVTESGAYTVQGMNASCTGTVSAGFPVTINAVPGTPTGASSHSRCDAGALTFSAALPDNCTDDCTMDWYTAAAGGSTVAAGTTSWTSGVLNSTTTYYALAKNLTTGCVSARLAVTGTIIEVATATIAGDAGNTCPAATVSLTATAAGATSYTWYKDGEEVQSGTSRNYTVAESGAYTVQGIKDACTGTVSAGFPATIECCADDCAIWTTCSSFTQVSSVSYENSTAMEWSIANTYCQNKGTGWRLPTLTELECMCANKQSLPGGYDSAVSYWSCDFISEGEAYIVQFAETCSASYTHEGWNEWVKCVK